MSTTKTDPKQDLDIYLDALGFEREYLFVPGRRFRADFRRGKILVEYEGGVFGGEGGHRATGRYLTDIEKYSLAAIHGFRVIRVTAKHVQNGEAFTWIDMALQDAA